MHSWNSDNEIIKEEFVQVVRFTIGEEAFAFDIFKVKEIIRMMEITKVPQTHNFIEGVINIRGTVVPIIDIRKRFGLSPQEYNRKTRIIVVEIEVGIIGFIVDTVLETRSIPASCIEATPTLITGGIDSEYIQGVAKLEYRLLILLDIDKILSFSEKKALKES